MLFLSTPSARRATTINRLSVKALRISIHALREEGDRERRNARGHPVIFLSTPSARRATAQRSGLKSLLNISIHALREEGDPKFKYPKQPDLEISIHALREEGDSKNRDKISIFKQIIQHSARI